MKIHYQLVLFTSICLSAISLACSSSSTPIPLLTSTPPTTETNTQVRKGSPVQLMTRPQLWLSPQPPETAIGPADYFDLLAANALWK
jgi:hypothetical protein